jgi:hypothetical protein
LDALRAELDEIAAGLVEIAALTEKPTRLIGWVARCLNRKGCLLRFAYTHAHALQQQQQQQQQGVGFEGCITVLAIVWSAASLAGLEQFAPLRSN